MAKFFAEINLFCCPYKSERNFGHGTFIVKPDSSENVFPALCFSLCSLCKASSEYSRFLRTPARFLRKICCRQSLFFCPWRAVCHAVSKGVANFSGTADGIDLLTMRIPIFEIIGTQPKLFPYPLNLFSFSVFEVFFFILRIRSPHDAGIYRLSICNIRI